MFGPIDTQVTPKATEDEIVQLIARSLRSAFIDQSNPSTAIGRKLTSEWDKAPKIRVRDWYEKVLFAKGLSWDASRLLRNRDHDSMISSMKLLADLAGVDKDSVVSIKFENRNMLFKGYDMFIEFSSRTAAEQVLVSAKDMRKDKLSFEPQLPFEQPSGQPSAAPR